jgi:hypothetical protein
VPQTDRKELIGRLLQEMSKVGIIENPSHWRSRYDVFFPLGISDAVLTSQVRFESDGAVWPASSESALNSLASWVVLAYHGGTGQPGFSLSRCDHQGCMSLKYIPLVAGGTTVAIKHNPASNNYSWSWTIRAIDGSWSLHANTRGTTNEGADRAKRISNIMGQMMQAIGWEISPPHAFPSSPPSNDAAIDKLEL